MELRAVFRVIRIEAKVYSTRLNCKKIPTSHKVFFCTPEWPAAASE